MMTSANGNIFRVTGHLCGEFTGHREFPAQRPVTRSFGVSLICSWINGQINNRGAGDLRCHHANYDVPVLGASNATGLSRVSKSCPISRVSKSCPKFVEIMIKDQLTHWGRDKMATIFQTPLSNAFSWKKMFEFRLKFHWSLFPMYQ